MGRDSAILRKAGLPDPGQHIISLEIGHTHMEAGNLKVSKALDVLLMAFVVYLAVVRFREGMLGSGALFTVLAIVYLATFIVRIKNEKKRIDDK
ncbi:hypothetical protein [Bacillus sp. OxB-1]|uniref:hypothetical protein n=1 Tax=Bacillus sp. (strain OxB-1) TaxID=98228 RepID=UPI000597BB8A|nr:hypothetical protein [Bacillus sp. OxB-1]